MLHAVQQVCEMSSGEQVRYQQTVLPHLTGRLFVLFCYDQNDC